MSTIEMLFYLINYMGRLPLELLKQGAEKSKKEVESAAYLLLGIDGTHSFEHGYHQWRLPNGLLHRLNNQPAAIFEHMERYEYVFNGEHHRSNGPAIIDKSWYAYYIKGKFYTFEQFWEKQKHTKHATEIMAFILGKKNNK